MSIFASLLMVGAALFFTGAWIAPRAKDYRTLAVDIDAAIADEDEDENNLAEDEHADEEAGMLGRRGRSRTPGGTGSAAGIPLGDGSVTGAGSGAANGRSAMDRQSSPELPLLAKGAERS